jgi:hypothetical protein
LPKINSTLAKYLLLLIVAITFWYSPLINLVMQHHRFKDVDEQATAINNQLHLKGKIYCDNGYDGNPQHLGFLTHTEVIIRNPNFYDDTTCLNIRLQQSKIDYYIYFNLPPHQTDSLKSFNGYEEINHGHIKGLQVFKLK